MMVVINACGLKMQEFDFNLTFKSIRYSPMLLSDRQEQGAFCQHGNKTSPLLAYVIDHFCKVL